MHVHADRRQLASQRIQPLPRSRNYRQFVGSEVVSFFKLSFSENFLQRLFGLVNLTENVVFLDPEIAQIFLAHVFDSLETADFLRPPAQIDQRFVAGQIVKRIEYKIGVVIKRNEIIVFQDRPPRAPKRIVDEVGVRRHDHFKRILLVFFDQQRRQKLQLAVGFEHAEQVRRIFSLINHSRTQNPRLIAAFDQRQKRAAPAVRHHRRYRSKQNPLQVSRDRKIRIHA